jgi:hypothetical protein
MHGSGRRLRRFRGCGVVPRPTHVVVDAIATRHLHVTVRTTPILLWDHPSRLSVVLAVGCLYLNFDYVTLAFSLFTTSDIAATYNIQPIAISVLVTSVFFLLVNTTIPHLMILEFIFWTTKLRK